MRLAATLTLAAVAWAADEPPPNQAANRKLSLEGTAYTKPEEVAKFLGVRLGEGYIVIRLRATPLTGEPMLLSPDHFTLISRKNGERSGAEAPEYVSRKDDVVVELAKRAFPERETTKAIEGLLVFQLGGKLSPKDVGLIYEGPAGKLVIDFK